MHWGPRAQGGSGRSAGGADVNREEAHLLIDERIAHREARDFETADAIRERLRAGGGEVVDSGTGSALQAIKAPPAVGPRPTSRAVTLLTVVHGWQPDAELCV